MSDEAFQSARRSGSSKHKTSKSRPSESPEVQMSKACSYILRHGAEKEGLHIRSDGYVKVEELLARPKMRKLNCDWESLQRIVSTNDKQRFTLTFEPEPSVPSGEGRLGAQGWWIRANQGHTVSVEDLEVVEIQRRDQVPMAVHGTTIKAWDSIRKNGLSRMNRYHIHMAQGLNEDAGVISGMRSSSNIIIFVDVGKAMETGIKFFLSANGVILSPGDEQGYIPANMFEKTLRRRGGELKDRWDSASEKWTEIE